MPVKRSLLLLAVLTLSACAQAEATPYPDVTPLEPLPPVTTTNTGVNDEATESTSATTSTTTTTTTTTLPPTTGLQLTKTGSIGGDITPKSVIATGHGLFFAQNMMYRHTVTVYDTDGELLATIPDTVDLGELGIGENGTTFQGAPVEAAASSDGRYVYVSNYRMYGPGYGNAGGDDCDLGGWDESFVYRIDTERMAIDGAIPVGAVPKYLALTPDNATLLVTNWCSFDLSVVDTESFEEIARVPLGRHPRGIAVSTDGATAYVAVMGSYNIAVVNLATFDVDQITGVGANPRHLVLSPDGRYLYATLNGDDRVVRIDLATGQVIDRLATGDAPRSMAISDDGLSLYVVNYESDTVSKVDTGTMTTLEEIPVPHHPIGVAFDPETRSVWVASYSGAITIFQELASE